MESDTKEDVDLEQGVVCDPPSSDDIIHDFVEATVRQHNGPSEEEMSLCARCCDRCHTQNVQRCDDCGEWCSNAREWCHASSKSFYLSYYPECFNKYQQCCGKHCADVAEDGCKGCCGCIYTWYCSCPGLIWGVFFTVMCIMGGSILIFFVI